MMIGLSEIKRIAYELKEIYNEEKALNIQYVLSDETDENIAKKRKIDKSPPKKKENIEFDFEQATWDDLEQLAVQIAGREEEYYSQKHIETMAMITIPELYTTPETVWTKLGVENPIFGLLSSGRSVYYFSAVKTALEKELEAALINLKRVALSEQIRKTTGVIVTLNISPWFAAFLKGFGLTTGSGLPSYSQKMEGVMYRTDNVIPVTTGDMFSSVPYISYAADIPWHISRFCGMFSSLPFYSIDEEKHRMSNAIYTDTEIFLNFALSASEEDNESYAVFMSNPREYIQDHLSTVVDSCINAYKLLLPLTKTWAFSGGKRIILSREIDGSSTDQQIDERVGRILINFVINNKSSFNNQTHIIDNLQQTQPFYKERDNPIGRYLNYHTSSNSEISTVRNNVGKIQGMRGDAIFIRENGRNELMKTRAFKKYLCVSYKLLMRLI
jgi:hypothetical protein